MKEVQESVLIYSPVKEVFNTLADPQQQIKFSPEPNRPSEQISTGPIGKGSRFVGYYKGLGKVEYSYSEFKENQLIEQSVTTAFGTMLHRFIFEPTTGGTRLTQQIIVASNILGEVVWPLGIKNILAKRIHALNVAMKNYFEG